MAMRVIAILYFISKPTVTPDLGRAQYQLAGPQDDAHRFIIEDEGESCHAGALGNQPATVSQT